MQNPEPKPRPRPRLKLRSKLNRSKKSQTPDSARMAVVDTTLMVGTSAARLAGNPMEKGTGQRASLAHTNQIGCRRRGRTNRRTQTTLETRQTKEAGPPGRKRRGFRKAANGPKRSKDRPSGK